MAADPSPPTGRGLPVDVVRSPKRRKTVEARVVDGRIRLLIPARMSRREERHWVATMQRRLAPTADTTQIDLTERARILARRHDLPEPVSIRWVTNQGQRWGSCTPVDRTIRISSRIAAYPAWVVDAVVVHELAHLVEAGHGPAFQALVARYPKSERATGFLIAKGLDDDEQEEDADRSRPDDDADEAAIPPPPPGPATLF